MTFYQSVFSGELARSSFADFQASEEPAEQDNTMHSMLSTKHGPVLMAADSPNSMEYTPGNNFSVSLSGDAGRAPELLGQAVRRRDRHRAARAGAVGRHLRHVRRQVRRERMVNIAGAQV